MRINEYDSLQEFTDRVVVAIIGFAVGDALGVPVEFRSREELLADPVTDMTGGGTHGQTAGTWSDDTSMTLCVMRSIIEKGVDIDDQMKRFEDWLRNGTDTAHGEVFDIGGTTKASILRCAKGVPASECGETADYCCGNGSLMRILPIALYIAGKYDILKIDDNAADIIHRSSKCTHAHPRCLMACGIYASVVYNMFRCTRLQDAVHLGVSDAMSYYKNLDEFVEVFNDFKELEDICSRGEESVQSSGYVLHTLAAALWCLLNTDCYAECVLKAVNLGEDTDTTAAVAGGLAGLWYGYNTTLPLKH